MVNYSTIKFALYPLLLGVIAIILIVGLMQYVDLVATVLCIILAISGLWVFGFVIMCIIGSLFDIDL